MWLPNYVKLLFRQTHTYTFKWKERQYSDAVDWYVYKSASVAVQMSIECMCYVNTQRTFFLSAAKPACNSRRLQTALFFTDKHASLCSCWQWLTSFWNQLFCPLCRKHVHAYSTKHSHTHRRINTYRSAHILFFHTNTRTHSHSHIQSVHTGVSTQHSLHFAHREVSVWAGPGRAMLTLAGDLSP